MLYDKNEKPAKELLQLASCHGIETTDQMGARELSQAMQEKWLRKTEHQYQIPGGPPSDDERLLLSNLDLVDERTTLLPEVTGAFLLGATVVAVRKRLALIEKHREGTKIGTVYMLGGARPLDQNKESPVALCTPAELPFKDGWTTPATLPATEAQMMQLVFEQSALPSEWQGVFVDTPLQTTPDGKTRHPNTTDTVIQALKHNPPPGVYLVVSSQPFVARQTLNVQSALPVGFNVIGIGYAASSATPLKTFLDELARLLHEQLALTRTS